MGWGWGCCPSTNLCAINDTLSFLPVYCQFYECLGAWLLLELLMMKLVCYLNVDPSPPTSTSRPPDIIHVIGVPRPSPFFHVLPLLCIILNANRRTKKKGGGLWTRLVDNVNLKWKLHFQTTNIVPTNGISCWHTVAHSHKNALTHMKNSNKAWSETITFVKGVSA